MRMIFLFLVGCGQVEMTATPTCHDVWDEQYQVITEPEFRGQTLDTEETWTMSDGCAKTVVTHYFYQPAVSGQAPIGFPAHLSLGWFKLGGAFDGIGPNPANGER